MKLLWSSLLILDERISIYLLQTVNCVTFFVISLMLTLMSSERWRPHQFTNKRSCRISTCFCPTSSVHVLQDIFVLTETFLFRIFICCCLLSVHRAFSPASFDEPFSFFLYSSKQISSSFLKLLLSPIARQIIRLIAMTMVVLTFGFYWPKS